MFFKKNIQEPKVVFMNCALNCAKEACPANNWVVFSRQIIDDKGGKKEVLEGRCAIGWIPAMLLELRKELCRVIKEK